MSKLPNLQRLESEAIQILRDGVAEAENPVILFSGGKDSTVLAWLARKAFYPSPPPLPILHVDSTWEFADVIAFRDDFARAHGFKLDVYRNEEGFLQGLNPVDHGDYYTTVMRTEALKQALVRGGYDVIFGGARRDEESVRAKERIVSVRGRGHEWDPKNQRPELWSLYNWHRSDGQSLRAFPLSNWTEQDLWTYIVTQGIALCPLYFARPRNVTMHRGSLVVVDDPVRASRWGWTVTQTQNVRFRSLGCWPVTGASVSEASGMEAVFLETLSANHSERGGRIADGKSLEEQKRQGYF
ncbi:sulfate adenylyltransferase subunit CysD [Zhengella sp. ZM62]|uniref:sulfate adenylyltransferase subunit CysD n=1 Tax=Zhengella sedimenti TaxID=3390035 RepID=UPI0039756DFA